MASVPGNGVKLWMRRANRGFDVSGNGAGLSRGFGVTDAPGVVFYGERIMEAIAYQEAWGNYQVCPACGEKTPGAVELPNGTITGGAIIVFDCKDPGRWWHFHPLCWAKDGAAFLKEWKITPEAL